MNRVDTSFSRYVAARKDNASERGSQTTAYAYAGDRQVGAALDKIRPVTLAVESAVRFWSAAGKSQLLGQAVKVSERQFPAIDALARRCAERLRIRPPVVYISPRVGDLNAHTFGTSEDAVVVINGVLIDHLSETELLAVIGHECGHIQNNHVVYMTTLHLLATAGSLFVRWASQPAVLALRAWSRRAEITCDRAGLLCTGDLEASTAALIKLAVGSQKLYAAIDVPAYLHQLEEGRQGTGRFGELFASHPYLPKRVEALRIFARTQQYRQALGDGSASSGISLAACDQQVADLVAVWT